LLVSLPFSALSEKNGVHILTLFGEIKQGHVFKLHAALLFIKCSCIFFKPKTVGENASFGDIDRTNGECIKSIGKYKNKSVRREKGNGKS